MKSARTGEPTLDRCKYSFRFEKYIIPGPVKTLGLPQDLVESNRLRQIGRAVYSLCSPCKAAERYPHAA